MERTKVLIESKYIKISEEIRVFSGMSFLFFFSLFVLPQYFGVPFPLFDLTMIRIMIIVMALLIFGEKNKQKQFVAQTFKTPYNRVFIPYFIVLTYTLILRADINAFLNPAIEIISFYLLIYVFKNYFGIKKVMKYILIFTYIITVLGIVEYIIKVSPFSFLESIDGLYTGRFIRSGHYRIMGAANHSLGYGLMLITMVPIVCYDLEKDEINILKHKLLFILTFTNIILNGSRSTLSVFILELILLMLFSTKTNVKKLIIIGTAFLALFVCFLIVFRNSGMGRYILLQITSVMDELLGTTYSVKYGANTEALSSSSNYRDQLKYIFQIDWLNPFLGLGRKRSFSSEINGSFIQSIDNFYIAEYIRYAYPGMISYIGFLMYFLVHMFKNSILKKSQMSRMLFAGSISYCVNLLWVDSLQTLKYLYVLFAIFCCLPESLGETKSKRWQGAKLISKYIKS